MKKQFTQLPLFSTAILFIAVACFGLNANAQINSQQSSGKSGKGIKIKTPENFTPIEKWTNFDGVLLINLKQPAGTFVSYPNKGESTEQ